MDSGPSLPHGWRATENEVGPASMLEEEMWFVQNQCVVRNPGCCLCWSGCSGCFGVAEVQLSSRKGWEQHKRNLGKEAKWHSTQFPRHVSAKQERQEHSPAHTAVAGASTYQKMISCCCTWNVERTTKIAATRMAVHVVRKLKV